VDGATHQSGGSPVARPRTAPGAACETTGPVRRRRRSTARRRRRREGRDRQRWPPAGHDSV